MKKALLILLCFLALLPWEGHAQSKATVDARLKAYFAHYESADCRMARPKFLRSELNNSARTLRIYVSTAFGEQPFRTESVERIYDEIRAAMPAPVNRYQVTVYVGDRSLSDLIPNGMRRKKAADRAWSKAENYQGAPWVTNASRPYPVTQGLQGRHLAINASHGAYYLLGERKWDWQRPGLFCTHEDLLTQSIVYPYLIPMLENAGAVVFTARERDSQRGEVVIDNDMHPNEEGLYVEEHSLHTPWTDAADGFSAPDGALTDGVGAFGHGTARFIRTSKNRGQGSASAVWMPSLPEAGRYAVYVAYQTTDESVPDAHYVVVHKGGTTHFRVNQRMGGGIWTYLGTFAFDEGTSTGGMVALVNDSQHDGVVCADAVRFGGGMGSVARGVRADSMAVSGLPRYFEGARYWTHYAGFPYGIYANKNGMNDYAEDINARSHAVNHLLGGSVYCPDSAGLCVPLELAFALHTDAGLDRERIVGTLGICTTDHNEGTLGNGRLSRLASRDMVDMVMTSVADDIHRSGHPEWTRRGIWQRNYSESRISEVPSMILELLAHQNFNDMKLAHEPEFKFVVARAIYKGILRYVAASHGEDYVVQPLAPDHLALTATETGSARYRLSWHGVEDALEPSAHPTWYVVYTRQDDGDFDGGQLVKDDHLDVELEPGILYAFRVTAANKGGQSFPSETLAAGIPQGQSRGQVLVVNGFQRIGGPQVVETADSIGFDLDADPGVPYISTLAFCGRQTDFNPSSMQLGPDLCKVGASGDELVGHTLCGNTFDFAAVHASAILASGYTVSSVSRECFEGGDVHVSACQIIDLYLGLQNREVLSEAMRQRLSAFVADGGRLLVSGSYLGASCADDPGTQSFLHDVLGTCFLAGNRRATDNAVIGQNLTLPFQRSFNPYIYPLVRPEIIEPIASSSENFSLFAYQNSRLSAAVAAVSQAGGRTITLGFPFEAVGDGQSRQQAMAIMLEWLMAR